MIGIIGAMALETDAIIAEMKNKEESLISGIRFVKGIWQEKEVVVATCGVGKVFAALCAQTMILRYQPEMIINTGVAGTLSKKLHILDVAISEGVVQHDMDTSPLGDPPGLLSGINQVVLPADQKIALSMEQAARALSIHTERGIIASGDQFIAEDAQRDRIRSLFGAVCCEMEGAAIGQVCYVNEVPFSVLRAISDGDEGDATMDYPTFAKKAAARSVEILKRALPNL